MGIMAPLKQKIDRYPGLRFKLLGLCVDYVSRTNKRGTYIFMFCFNYFKIDSQIIMRYCNTAIFHSLRVAQR